jgi:hypothetical protein
VTDLLSVVGLVVAFAAFAGLIKVCQAIVGADDVDARPTAEPVDR